MSGLELGQSDESCQRPTNNLLTWSMQLHGWHVSTAHDVEHLKSPILLVLQDLDRQYRARIAAGRIIFEHSLS